MPVEPLVTCLCLTRNRRAWLPKSIACFQAQAYPNREMLIVADGEEVSDLIPAADPRIRLVRSGERAGIGEKRNRGSELAHGELIATWDDDDHSEPARLVDQVTALLASGLDVIGYSRLRFTDGQNWWRYRLHDHAHGTSLMYRRSWWQANRFREGMPYGEDTVFAWKARNLGRLLVVEARDLMYATIHAGNTCLRGSMSPKTWEAL